MQKLKLLAAVAGAVLIFTSRAAYADMADGSYTNDFSGVVPVWDISGVYPSGDLGGIDLYFSVSEDPSGKFTGGGDFDYDTGYGDIGGNITASGTVKNSGTVTRVTMKLLLSGSGNIDGDDVVFTASATYNSEIDSADSELIGSGSAKITVKDLDTGKKKSESGSLGKDLTMELPASAIGDWNLTLNLTTNKTKYTGTATVVTSTGATADYTATGSYTAKKDTSKITLKGTGLSKGSSLSLLISTVGANLTVDTLSGKVFGQSVKFKAP
jgi:hypothetical protein